MPIKYPKAIVVSEEELMRREQGLRGQKPADRVRLLRLLKSGTAKSLKDCAPMVGYRVSQLTRWWERYRAEGLAGLLKRQKPAGKPWRLTPQAWTGLLAQKRAGHLVTMQEGRNYLEGEWGISYKNGKSLWWLFKKHRVKWKTGRRRHKTANAEQQAAFKKLREPRKAIEAFAERVLGGRPLWPDHLAPAALVSIGRAAALDSARRVRVALSGSLRRWNLPRG